MTRQPVHSGTRKGLPNLLRWLITLGLLGLVASLVDFRQLASTVHNVQWLWVVLAAGAAFGDRVVATIRWWILLRVKRIDIGFMPLLNLHLAASFVGSFLPTSFGADAARIVMLSRRTGRLLETVAASAADRLAMIATTVVAAVIVSSLFISEHFPEALQWTVLATGGAGVFACASLLVLGRTGIISRIGSMGRMVLGDRIASKAGRLTNSVYEYRHCRMALVQSVAFSMVVLAIRALMLVLMARAFGIRLPIPTAAVLWPMVGVVLMLPVSIGNLGLQEGTYIALLGVIGIPAAMAVSISLLDHVLARVVLLPGAVLWLWSVPPEERMAESTTEPING